MSINKVFITGNLTRDPELRETASGFQVLNFGVAVNDRRKNQQTQQWEDYANFVDCTMFGNRAGSVARFLAKGSKVAIEGKLRWSQWETQDGSKRSKLEVVVDEIEFMTSRDGGQQQQYQQQQYQQQQYQQQQYQQPQYQPQADVYDAEIPF